jgi:predicted methyltransferase
LTDSGRIVAEVAAAVGLAEGEAGVGAIIAALARLEPVSTRRLSRTVELPVPIVASVCGELRKRSVVAEERPAQLTRSGRLLFAGERLELDRSACPTCAGLGSVVPGKLGRLAAEIAKIARTAPKPRLDLDQCHCTVGTKLRRVLAMNDADALVGRKILLLGDDDLISLAIQSVVRAQGRGPTVRELAVLDIDPAVISFLVARLADAPFPTSCVVHDLREPLPRQLESRFDTIATDPPYTVPAARLFLSRAAEALRGQGGNVFFSFGSRRPGAAREVQRAIGEMGFVIRRLVPDFNEYVGAGALGGTSHLYHLVATRELRPVVSGTSDAPLYTAEASDQAALEEDRQPRQREGDTEEHDHDRRVDGEAV